MFEYLDTESYLYLSKVRTCLFTIPTQRLLDKTRIESYESSPFWSLCRVLLRDPFSLPTPSGMLIPHSNYLGRLSTYRGSLYGEGFHRPNVSGLSLQIPCTLRHSFHSSYPPCPSNTRHCITGSLDGLAPQLQVRQRQRPTNKASHPPLHYCSLHSPTLPRLVLNSTVPSNPEQAHPHIQYFEDSYSNIRVLLYRLLFSFVTA